jgi:hypothetical protein
MDETMTAITIASRFNGPPSSGNGGYSAGMIAAAIGQSVAVRLHQPVPLERELIVSAAEPDRWEVRDATTLVASAKRVSVQADAPQAPPYPIALGASKHYAGFKDHPFGTCFVCGPQRHRHDGLCIFPGTVPNTSMLAAPWLPDASLDNGEGKVRPEFVWAALDCPGYFAGAFPTAALLGELAVHVDRLVHVDEPCVVISWSIARDGRKIRTGTALFDEDGERCALGVATWIELKGSD